MTKEPLPFRKFFCVPNLKKAKNFLKERVSKLSLFRMFKHCFGIYGGPRIYRKDGNSRYLLSPPRFATAAFGRSSRRPPSPLMVCGDGGLRWLYSVGFVIARKKRMGN